MVKEKSPPPPTNLGVNESRESGHADSEGRAMAMTLNGTVGAYNKKSAGGGMRLIPTVHSPAQECRYLVVLFLSMVLLASVYPLLAQSDYRGSSDLHATIEMVGALLGLVSGLSLVIRFQALGSRFHFFIGLAFFINSAEDFIHGLMSFRNLFGLPASSLAQFIPGTYVTGRIMLAVLLIIAPLLPKWLGESINPKQETNWVFSLVLLVTMALTALAFYMPLPEFIYPGRFISRPVDFFSAVLLMIALGAFLREYHIGHDMLTWWVSLSIGVNIIGQLMMSFSKSLYDPFFDIAHVYKVLGYLVLLIGVFFFYVASLIGQEYRGRETKLVLESAFPSAEEKIPTPFRLVGIIMTIIFFVEFLLMYVLSLIPPMSPLAETVVDTVLLIILISPPIYFFVLHPMIVSIAERARAEERLKETMGRLEHSNRDLQQFAYIASHDLQEPLRMVASFVQLLERRYKGKLDADADDFINFAVDGAHRMQTLIEDLLKYSRIGTRGDPFKPADCEKIFDHVLDGLQVMIEENGAVVTRDPLPTVSCDETQIARLLQNLIVNGIRFRGDAPPEIHLSARRGEGEWIFSVRDNGVGIDPQYFERIFVIFQRLHGKEEYPEGTGIGLAVCKRIVERHGGRIWVESGPEKGSAFHFSIPDMEKKQNG